MKRISKNIYALGFVSLFTDMASSMVNPILPLFLILVLDEGVDKVGYVLAVTMIMSYMLRFVGGALSDKFDRNKPLLVAGYGLSCIAKPFLSFVGTWQEVTVIRSAERFGKALRAAPKDKLISLSSHKGQTGKTFGFHKSLDLIGEFSGLTILLVVLFFWGTSEGIFRDLFLLSLIPGVLAVLALMFFVKDMPSGQVKKRFFKFGLDKNLRLSVFLFCVISAFLFNDAFLVLRSNDFGVSITQIVMMIMAMRLTQVAISYHIGKIIDKNGDRILLFVGYFLGLIATASLFYPTLIGLWIAFIFYGLSEVIMLNCIRSKISHFAKDKGAAFGLFYLLYAISTAVGIAGLSYIWEHFGINTALMISVIATIVCIGLYATFNISKEINPI